mmetsp:Transcript_27891/g.52158  ORF Transcript_27891/g.52158 Transcript_27891/m.52158 type:complete len:723 (+) Transcript_27891:518-2686(+)
MVSTWDGSLLCVGDGALQDTEGRVQQHADDADHEDREDDGGEIEIVPLVPDIIADACAPHEHLGGDDHQPGDADGNAHAGDDGRRGGGQDHGKGGAQTAKLVGAGHVDPVLAHTGHTEGGVDEHRPDRADEDHEDRACLGILDNEQGERHPCQRRDRAQHLDEGVERLVGDLAHADQEAERNGHERGKDIARQHAVNRIADLDADALVVGAGIIEGIAELVPGLGQDIRGRRHAGAFLPEAHQKLVFGQVLGGFLSGDRGLPDQEAADQHDQRQDRGTLVYGEVVEHGSPPPDREAFDIGFGLSGIECLAHDRVRLVGDIRRVIAELFHDLLAVAREIDLFGHGLVVDIALDIAPTLHLGEDPDAHRVPGEGIEIDPVGHFLNRTEAIGECAGEHLFDHRNRLVEIVGGRDRGRDFLAVVGVRGVLRRVDDRLEKRAIGVGQLLGEGQWCGEGTAGVALPDVLGEHVDEADAFPDRALVERVGREIAIEIAGAQVGDHLGRGNDADLDIDIRVEPEFGHVIAQQEVVHRVFEGHAEGEALPLGRVALVEMFVGQHDRLTVDVLDGGHDVGFGHRPGAERHRQGHRGQHVAGVIFARERLVAGHGPAGGLDDLCVQPVAFVKAHRLRHDDRGGAGDRHEADVEIGLFGCAQLVQQGGLGLVHREDGGERGGKGTAAHHAHEGPPVEIVLPEDGTDNRAFDGAFEHLFGVHRGRFDMPLVMTVA